MPAGYAPGTSSGEGALPHYLSKYSRFLTHVARYEFAGRFVSGLCLDAGCGTGYGAALLARAGARVCAIGISPHAIQYATRYFSQGHPHYLVGDVARLGFQGLCLDAVVAFEVIEHVSDYTGFVAELARVCHVGAPLVISRPNRLKSQGNHPFRVVEFSLDEFRNALEPYFETVLVAGQFVGRRTQRLEQAAGLVSRLMRGLGRPMGPDRVPPVLERKVAIGLVGLLSGDPGLHCVRGEVAVRREIRRMEDAHFFVIVAGRR